MKWDAEAFVPGDGTKFHVKKTQDVAPVLDSNARARSMGAGAGEDLWHVARIPVVVLEIWAKEAGVDVMSDEFEEIMHKKLMSGEFGKLRIKEGNY